MTIRDQWPALAAQGDWQDPPAAKQLAAVASKLPQLPPALRELYTKADGGHLATVDFFDLDELEDVNLKQKYRKTFPDAVFFASDGGDRFFFVDTSGSLERGEGAVMIIDRGAARPQNCVLAARDLDSFFAHLLNNERPWLQRKSLAASEVSDMLELVAASSDRYSGQPYDVMSDAIDDAVSRVGVRLPVALARLLRKVDGMRIPAAGVTVWPAARLEAVSGLRAPTGYAALLWFADDDAGNRYAIAPGDWRDVPEGGVVRVAPGADPATAPAIGRLPRVITDWLGAT